jgi:hypothetical protein
MVRYFSSPLIHIGAGLGACAATLTAEGKAEPDVALVSCPTTVVGSIAAGWLVAAALGVGRAGVRMGACAVGVVEGLGVGALATCGTAELLQAESASTMTSTKMFGQSRKCMGVLMRCYGRCCTDAVVHHLSVVREKKIADTAYVMVV